jgi:hypothetical protein
VVPILTDADIGVQNGSKRNLSDESRKLALTLIQKGDTPEDAIKKATVRKGVVVPLQFFSFRPPNRGEQARAYLALAQAEWVRYLKDNGIDAVIEMRAVPRSSKTTKTATPRPRSWVGK